MAFGADMAAKFGINTASFMRGASAIQGKITKISNGTFNQSKLRSGNEAIHAMNGSLTTSILKADALASSFRVLVGVLKNAAQMAAATEQTLISFEVLAGDKQLGHALFGEMEKLAQQTPLTLQETSQAAKQLLVSFDAANIPGMVRMLGNISSSFDNVTLQEMAWLMQTTRTEGKLFARDIKQFTTRGIPLVDALVKVKNLSGPGAGSKIMEMASDGLISAEDAYKALQEIGSNDMLAKQAKTATGAWNQAADSIRFIVRDLGMMIMKGFDVVGFLNNVRDKASEFREVLKTWEPVIMNVASMFRAGIDAMGQMIGKAFGWVTDKIGVTGENVKIFVTAMASGAEFIAKNWEDYFELMKSAIMLTLSEVFDWFHNRMNWLFGWGRKLKLHWKDIIVGGKIEYLQPPEFIQSTSKKTQELANKVGKLKDKLDGGMSEFVRQRIDEALNFEVKDAPLLPEAGPIDWPQLLSGDSKGSGATSFGAMKAGSVEAWNAIVEAMNKGKDPVVSAIEQQTEDMAAFFPDLLTQAQPAAIMGFGE